MITKDLGPFYTHGITYPVKPKELFEKAESQETEVPFRRGAGFAVRFPFTRKAIVIGKWKKTGYTESEALTYAINGRPLAKDELDWDFIRFGEAEKEYDF